MELQYTRPTNGQATRGRRATNGVDAMTKEAAARIVDGLNTTQRISLRIMVEETRLGSFAAGAAAFQWPWMPGPVDH